MRSESNPKVLRPIVNVPKPDMFPIAKPGLPTRLSLVLWGLYGAGKTTWAATAPGKKLWLSFGDTEVASILKRIGKDVEVINMYLKSKDEIFQYGIGANPYGLAEKLQDEKVGTLVCDSLSVLAQLGIEKAVDDNVGASRKTNFVPTIAVPGIAAWGARNQNMLMVMKSLMQLTARLGIHIIFTAHEEDPVLRPDGTVEVIRVQLGGKLLNLVSSSLSEVWCMHEEMIGKRRRIISVRPWGNRRPMKTRMFQPGGWQFALEYDPTKPDNAPGQMTIAGFYEQWMKKGESIPIPNNYR
jgi:AAA domain